MAKKHVIILGAGASKSSGYPLANELRLWMSSREHLSRVIHPAGSYALEESWAQEIDQMFNLLTRPITLFRAGGFATVDEFCKLGSGYGLQEEINQMRSWTRSALSVWNPEEEFEKSAYYGFVQALFQTNLHDLRSDITVLSFNYDVYLEYLLTRALKTRRMVSGASEASTDLFNSVTSGFFNPTKRAWFSDGGEQRFCLLKLHGSVAYPEEPFGSPFNYELLFSTDETRQTRRIAMALEPTNVKDYPPIIFPWESIESDTGRFCLAEKFPHGHRQDELEVFRSIWARARNEVARAKKVSFVGISMHPFMEWGLRYLFGLNEGEFEFVVANPANRLDAREMIDPRCPAGKLQAFFKTFSSEDFKFKVRMVDSFETFIAEEM